MSLELTKRQQKRHDVRQRALMDANPSCYEDALDAVWGYFEDLEEEDGWPDWLTNEIGDALFDLFDPGLDPEDMALAVAEHIWAGMKEDDNERI